jgi:CBS domain containing-hemolysin-like protein
MFIVTVLAALMAAEEAASALLSPGRVLRLVDADRRGSHALEALFAKVHRLRAAAALSSAIAYAVASAGCIWILDSYSALPPVVAMAAGPLIAVVFVFSFGHALPRTIAVQNPEDVALSFAPAARRAMRLLYGPAKFLSALWVWGMRLAVGQEAVRSAWVSEDDYRTAQPDDVMSVREETEEALLEAVSDFAEKIVREVMVPRTDMTCVPDTATVAEAVNVITGAGYSRLPVYHETLDDIRGVLYAKDLLDAVMRNPEVVPASIVREPFFVPETKPVQELLIEMQARTHIAIVADEYGGTAGLVTIEDLLEEIVGEIHDEYDLEVALVSELADGRFLIDARLPVDDLNERFGTAIESDSDTVGGVVIEVAGKIPAIGDAVEIEGLRLVVHDSQGTRIRQLVVQPAGTGETREAHDA